METLSGFRARLHRPGAVAAAMMAIPHPAIGSILGSSGFDCVMLDAEHGPFTLSLVQGCLEALKATPAAGVVRTGSADKTEIQQYLDVGADGLLVPHVESADEAAAIVRAARYPPEGARGIGFVRANRYGLDFAAPLSEVNARVAVMVIIESGRGVENAAEIAAVPGLDGVIIGPTDLAADLGVLEQPDDSILRDCVTSVVSAATAAGLKVGAPGWAVADPDSVVNVCFADLSALAEGAQAALEHARVHQ